MRQVELKPIREPKSEYDKIEEEIKELFRKFIYLPLILELTSKKQANKLLKNSTDDLMDAITSGKISFYRGHFSGQLDATISSELRRLGAIWDRKRGTFAIPYSKLPIYIKQAIDTSASQFEKTAERINKKLKDVSPAAVAEKLKVDKILDKTLFKVESQFEKSVKGLVVAPQVSKEKRARLTKEYTTNMQRDIKGWIEEEIIDLRKRVEKQIFDGKRAESMISMIEKRYGVSQSKAKFLAGQETRLLVNKYKEIRYQDAGVNQYKWRCVIGSSNHPVRKQHKKLNDESSKGKLFSFDDPPIVTEPGEKVRRANPGEDFECRCLSIPVVRLQNS